MTTTTRPRRRTTASLLSALATVSVLGLVLGGCGGATGGTSSSDAGGSNLAPAAADMGLAEAEAPARERDGITADQSFASEDKAANAAEAGVFERSVISTGVVSLRGDDVGQARFDVQKVVDEHGGEITDEKTETDDEGDVARSRMVIRVPAAEFDETMTALQGVAELQSSNRSSEDVTTQVIDTEVRVRAQEESLKRIEVLLARARSIRDIVAIEAQLTRRQADLDSLKQQQAWLRDQTTMSTITVHLERKPTKAEKKTEDTGFLAGLASGWDGLRSFATGAATLLGLLLPFAVVLLLLGLPGWYVVRRLWHRRMPAADEPAAA